MNIFKVNDSLYTYTYPAIKITIALAVIVMCIFRSHLIHTNSEPISIVITVICFVLTIASIFAIYISASEIGYAYENREAKKIQSTDSFTSKDYTIDEIVEIVEKNDIMDIVIKSEKRVVKIGASSNCKHSNYIFFDKLYYVDDNEYDTIDKFIAALTPLSMNGKIISVISIDGIRPK